MGQLRSCCTVILEFSKLSRLAREETAQQGNTFHSPLLHLAGLHKKGSDVSVSKMLHRWRCGTVPFAGQVESCTVALPKEELSSLSKEVTSQLVVLL